jgi:hypothetical protein
LEVPGFIEGTFLSSESGIEDLMAVEVEIDTDILSSMVEKSCRTIVRSSIEHICKEGGTETTTKDVSVKEVEEVEVNYEQESESSSHGDGIEDMAASPHPSLRGSPGGSVGSNAVIVTPRARAPWFDGKAGNDKSVYLPIPDDLDEDRRRITPQLHSQGNSPFTPMTPSRQEIKQTPSMVSPAPNKSNNDDLDTQDNGFRLSKRVNAPSQNGQNLPVLVEVACAQMQVSNGLTGQ